MAITNLPKVSAGETWGSITTTWANESRTWLAVSQLFTNPSKVSADITNLVMSSTDPLWSYRTYPWLETSPWTLDNAGITNVTRPS